MSETTYLALVPRDGFFCKDGRGWHTSASGRGYALDWPHPSTLLGALRTACGRALERSGERLDGEGWKRRTADITLGTSLALRRSLDASWDEQTRVWPVPADARWLDRHANVVRLSPRPSSIATLGSDDDEAREALWVARLDDPSKPLSPPAWWSDADFMRWLRGADVDASGERLSPPRRTQVHVGIRPEEQTADDGVLFSHDVIETLEHGSNGAFEWGVGCELSAPEGLVLHTATLGSDGRLAAVQHLPPRLFAPSDAVLEACDGCLGLRIVIVTPAAFDLGWVPDGLTRRGSEYRGRLNAQSPEVVLRAALVARPVHISGWDMVSGKPKLTGRFVPRGSVYFVARCDGKRFDREDARQLWLAAIVARTTEGFGRIVPGPWNPGRG